MDGRTLFAIFCSGVEVTHDTTGYRESNGILRGHELRRLSVAENGSDQRTKSKRRLVDSRDTNYDQDSSAEDETGSHQRTQSEQRQTTMCYSRSGAPLQERAKKVGGMLASWDSNYRGDVRRMRRGRSPGPRRWVPLQDAGGGDTRWRRMREDLGMVAGTRLRRRWQDVSVVIRRWWGGRRAPPGGLQEHREYVLIPTTPLYD
ncbi:hypothetical protein AAG570_002660 [Ranatra chinensis]|uniref:Uncharacterized protein n=1 Tax=Ranatra chinensis TaxID=642074 RepID=A0ABD0YWN4_9HEMI